MKQHAVIFTILFKLSVCRDFYVGSFKKNDLLVADDTLFQEKRHFGFTTAKYGRVFHCPITYFRVVDRLGGAGRPPGVRITRGGLQKKYIHLIITSSYNMPIAVNIYVGCENKLTTRTTTTTVATTTEADTGNATTPESLGDTTAAEGADADGDAKKEDGEAKQEEGDDAKKDDADEAQQGEGAEGEGNEAPAEDA